MNERVGIEGRIYGNPNNVIIEPHMIHSQGSIDPVGSQCGFNLKVVQENQKLEKQ